MTQQDQQRIRLCWEGSCFVYRRATGFAEEYLTTCIQLLRARNTMSGVDPLYLDAVSAIALSMVRLNLPWRALPKPTQFLHAPGAGDPLQRLINDLEHPYPQVAAWLRSVGSLKNPASLLSRFCSCLLRVWRNRQEKSYLRTC